jgi:hypothetical protein
VCVYYFCRIKEVSTFAFLKMRCRHSFFHSKKCPRHREQQTTKNFERRNL